jgi:hypothetical protein
MYQFTTALKYSGNLYSTRFNNKNPELCPKSAMIFLLSSCNVLLTNKLTNSMVQSPSQKAKICSCNKQSLYTDTAFAKCFFFSVESNYVLYDVQTASFYKPKGLMHNKFSNFRIQRVDKTYRQQKRQFQMLGT